MASNPSEANEPQIEAADETKAKDYRFTVLQEEGKAGFSANDLVWGKINGHLWWPGQIFDPKYASEVALRCQKKDHFLVAYFGDMSFAWVPESQLKPFQSHFLEMEEQSDMASFVSAVSAVLEEVSKRVELGLACRCAGRLLECRKVENAGVREGTCSIVDKFTVANAFRPESLLRYVWALAQCPSSGFVMLELTVAEAQLEAFYRSKGHSQLSRFAFHFGFAEDEAEIPHLMSTRPRGGARKNHINEEEEDADYWADCDKKWRDADIDSADLGRSEKDGVGKEADLKTRMLSSTPTRTKSIWLGDHILRAAHRLKVESPVILDAIDDTIQDGVTGARSSTRTRARSVWLGDHILRAADRLKVESPVILDSIDDTIQDSVTRRREGGTHLSRAEKGDEVSIKEYSSPREMLSQLYLAARDPMNGCDFPPMILSFFTDFRNSSEDLEPVKSTGRKRGKKKKVVECEPASLEMSDPDFRVSPSSNSYPDLEPVKSTGRKRGRKKKVECEPASLEMSDPDFRISPSSNSSDDQEPVRSAGRKRGRKKKVVNCEPASKEMSDPDFRSSPSLDSPEDQEPVKSTGRKRGRKKKVVSSDDQEPVKSTGRKRGRKKKVVSLEPALIEVSDPDFKFSPSSDSPEDQEPVKSVERRSARKKKVNAQPDYIEDSYWSDIIFQSSPERKSAPKVRKKKKGSQKKGRTKKTKPAGESVLFDPKAPSIDTEQDNLLVGFSNPHEKQEAKEERIVEETPTALILSFNEYDSIPSAADLVKIFSCYGSLKEEETVVLRKTNRAKVVFKYRRDAENAFSSAEQSGVFGPALVSYRLRDSPSPKSSPTSSPLDMNYALPTKDGDLEHQGQEGIGVAIDNM